MTPLFSEVKKKKSLLWLMDKSTAIGEALSRQTSSIACPGPVARTEHLSYVWRTLCARPSPRVARARDKVAYRDIAHLSRALDRVHAQGHLVACAGLVVRGRV